jgi:hypothetical protein
VKRGIVAGYLHDLSPRHRVDGSAAAPDAGADQPAAGAVSNVRR